jgi:hypothetical protein
MSGFIFSIVDFIARETFQERLDYPSHRLMFRYVEHCQVWLPIS